MYKSYKAQDYRIFLGLPDDYKVDGFIDYGTGLSIKFPLEQLENSLKNLGIKYVISKLDSDALSSVSEIKVDKKIYWFTNAYGGAELSELLHFACLFGSKKNIHMGSCGGLKKGSNARDLIIPTWSYAEESSAKAYQPDACNKYEPNKKFCDKLEGLLSNNHKIYRGPTITCQAVLAQTIEDINNWSRQGYYGVEMEAATLFSVSSYFKVPAAAVIMILDNLIEEETILDKNFVDSRSLRRQVSQSVFDVVVREIIG
ncbi:MAG: hypothetical protein WCQ49_02730 [Candidatus Saccharibacteria bacterium]